MAVVSRIATLRMTNTVGGDFREWVATAAVQDTAAGQSVAITVTRTTSGIAPPPAADTLTLRVFIDNTSLGGTSGAVREFSLTPDTASQVVTFHMTDNGQSGGAPRAGTLRMQIHAVKTTSGPTNTYNINSDNAGTMTPQVGTSVTITDQGWIRATTTSTIGISNVSLGGAKTEPAVYDESIFTRQTLGHTLFQARSFTHVLSNGGGSAASNSTASGNYDVTRSAICDNRFPAGSTSVGVSVTIPNATLTGQPFTAFTGTAPTDSITIDPRLTAEHLFQLDDNSIGTPPLSKHAPSGERPSTSIAYLTTNFRHARGSKVADVVSGGVNGVTATITLTADLNGDQVSRSGVVTATQGGEAGWLSGFLQWTSPLPGGEWDKAVTITAPSDITGASYLLNSTASYQLLAARSPFIEPLLLTTNLDPTADARHWAPGDPINFTVALISTKDNSVVELDDDPVPTMILFRVREAQFVEYLDSDEETWTSLTDLTGAYQHPMDLAATSAGLTLLDTSTFDGSDLYTIIAVNYQAVRYSIFRGYGIVGPINPHDGHEFDPIGLFS